MQTRTGLGPSNGTSQVKSSQGAGLPRLRGSPTRWLGARRAVPLLNPVQFKRRGASGINRLHSPVTLNQAWTTPRGGRIMQRGFALWHRKAATAGRRRRAGPSSTPSENYPASTMARSDGRVRRAHRSRCTRDSAAQPSQKRDSGNGMRPASGGASWHERRPFAVGRVIQDIMHHRA